MFSFINICIYIFLHSYIATINSDKIYVGAYADNEEDYTYQNYSFTFNSTNDEFQVIIRPVDDNIVEPDEYFTLNISLIGKRGDHFEYKNQAAKVTIYNDDGKYIQ